MATKNVNIHPPRASFDASVLSKRTSFEALEKESIQSKKRCSLDVKSHQAPQAPPGFVPPGLSMGGAHWAAPFSGMPMGMPMGMPGMPMGGMMPYCFPAPFIPPFMMPAAMAFWQQAVQQATATVPVNTALPAYGGMMPPNPMVFASPSPAPPVPSPPLPSIYEAPFVSSAAAAGILKAETSPANSSSSQSLCEPSTPELCDNDFATFIDSFLSTPEGALKSSDSALALAQSFGCGLDLLGADDGVAGGSVSELSELTDCCKPLDLKLTRDDSHLNLLDLDLKFEEEVGL